MHRPPKLVSHKPFINRSWSGLSLKSPAERNAIGWMSGWDSPSHFIHKQLKWSHAKEFISTTLMGVQERMTHKSKGTEAKIQTSQPQPAGSTVYQVYTLIPETQRLPPDAGGRREGGRRTGTRGHRNWPLCPLGYFTTLDEERWGGRSQITALSLSVPLSKVRWWVSETAQSLSLSLSLSPCLRWDGGCQITAQYLSIYPSVPLV